jgi:hypothetical protein
VRSPRRWVWGGGRRKAQLAHTALRSRSTVPLRFHCSLDPNCAPRLIAFLCLPSARHRSSSLHSAHCTTTIATRAACLPLHRLRSALRQPPSLTCTFPLLLPHQDSRRIDRVASPSPSLPFFLLCAFCSAVVCPVLQRASEVECPSFQRQI